MRFRQFEFRLFPKIKSKKKKKAGKLCHHDYPRDIGLDRKCNYSTDGNHGYYDNMAVEINCNDQLSAADIYNNVDNYGNCYSCYGDGGVAKEKRPLDLQVYSNKSDVAELKVNVDCVCNCTLCLDTYTCYEHSREGDFSKQSVGTPYGSFVGTPSGSFVVGTDTYTCYGHSREGDFSKQSVGTPSESVVGSPSESFVVGTPSTLSRPRTRIKTNPWLPSPRTTPTPSPTTESSDPFQRCYSNCPSLSLRYRTSTSKSAPSFSGLVKIADDIHDVTTDASVALPETNCRHKPNQRLSDASLLKGYRLSLPEKQLGQHDFLTSKPSPDATSNSGSDDLFYDTDISNNVSPDANPFSKSTRFRFGFSYENCVDALLETTAIPRDDTFESLKTPSGCSSVSDGATSPQRKIDVNVDLALPEFVNDSYFENDQLLTQCSRSNNKRSRSSVTMETETEVRPTHANYIERTSQIDLVDGVQRHSKDNVVKSADAGLCLLPIGSNQDPESKSCFEAGVSLFATPNFDDSPASTNMQDSIDTGYASCSRDLDSNSETSDDVIDDSHDTNHHTSDLELEWDHEPQVLTLDSTVTTTAPSIAAMHDWNASRPTTSTQQMTLPSTSHAHSSQTKPDDTTITDFCYKHSDVVMERDVSFRTSVKRKCNTDFTDRNCIRRSRSLADIELSLDEKVTMLREQKTYVQMKVQESINEDQIRHKQNKILESISKTERKQVLLKTLYDLKTRLEDQSARLQSSYTTVLTLRKRFSQRRASLSPLSPLETDI